MLTPLATWLLAIIVYVQPHAPWSATYEATAASIARVVESEPPLFAGALGRERTAVVLLETAVEEGALRPDAVGDHGTSLCMMQVSSSNLERLGVTREQILTDVETCLRAGLRMMRASMSVCRERPLEERQAQYLAGGGDCEANEVALRRSRHRMRRAQWLFSHRPPP